MQFKRDDHVIVLSGTERRYSFPARVIRARFNWVLIEEISGHECKSWLVTPSNLKNIN